MLVLFVYMNGECSVFATDGGLACDHLQLERDEEDPELTFRPALHPKTELLSAGKSSRFQESKEVVFPVVICDRSRPWYPGDISDHNGSPIFPTFMVPWEFASGYC